MSTTVSNLGGGGDLILDATFTTTSTTNKITNMTKDAFFEAIKRYQFVVLEYLIRNNEVYSDIHYSNLMVQNPSRMYGTRTTSNIMLILQFIDNTIYVMGDGTLQGFKVYGIQ